MASTLTVTALPVGLGNSKTSPTRRPSDAVPTGAKNGNLVRAAVSFFGVDQSQRLILAAFQQRKTDRGIHGDRHWRASEIQHIGTIRFRFQCCKAGEVGGELFHRASRRSISKEDRVMAGFLCSMWCFLADVVNKPCLKAQMPRRRKARATECCPGLKRTAQALVQALLCLLAR